MSKRTLFTIGITIAVVVVLLYLALTSTSLPQLTPPLLTFKSPATYMAWSPQGDKLALASTNEVSVWAIPTVQANPQRLNVLATTNRVFELSWAPDGERLALGYEDGVTQIWDTTVSDALISLDPLSSGVLQIYWSPDGKELSVASSREVVIWDATSNRLSFSVVDFGPIRWAANNDYFVAVLDPITTRVWDSETNEIHGDIEVSLIALSPDGTRIASAFPGIISIWDIATGNLIARATDGLGGGIVLSWSPDGTRVANAMGPEDEDNTVYVWDAFTGELILVLDGHQDDVIDLGWQDDGERLVSASNDSSLRIWNMPDGVLIRELNLPRIRDALSLSPDGTMVALIIDEDTVQIWSLTDGTSG